MAELLPDRMGTANFSIADESTKQKARRRPVSSIIEWVHAVLQYISICHVQDLPGKSTRSISLPNAYYRGQYIWSMKEMPG